MLFPASGASTMPTFARSFGSKLKGHALALVPARHGLGRRIRRLTESADFPRVPPRLRTQPACRAAVRGAARAGRRRACARPMPPAACGSRSRVRGAASRWRRVARISRSTRQRLHTACLNARVGRVVLPIRQVMYPSALFIVEPRAGLFFGLPLVLRAPGVSTWEFAHGCA